MDLPGEVGDPDVHHLPAVRCPASWDALNATVARACTADAAAFH